MTRKTIPTATTYDYGVAVKLAEKLGVTAEDATNFIEAFKEIIVDSLEKQEKVVLKNLGTFQTRIATPRTINHFYTKELVQVPESKCTVFSSSKSLKDKINKKSKKKLE